MNTGEAMAQKKRKRNKNIVLRFGTAAFVLVILLGLFLLFRVSKIRVYGNERHSSEEISADLMQNTFLKNTLYLLWKFRDGEVPDNMAFLNSLHVQMKSPSHIDVHVTEKKPVAYLEKGGYVYIDQEGIVLEISDEPGTDVPIVTGVSVEEPLLYQKLPAQSSAQLRTILSLTQLLSEQGVAADEIRFGENMEITLYVGDIETELGQDEYLEEKTANLAKILPRLENQRGVLHMESFTGRNEQVPFTPEGAAGTDNSGDASDGENEDGQQEGDGEGADDSGDSGLTDTGENGGSDQDGLGGNDENGEGQDSGDDAGEDQESTTVYPMVFNSSGTLVYNVHVENGIVVDEYGNPVPGVTVNENGNVVDAYMNVFDPNTGELIQ